MKCPRCGSAAIVDRTCQTCRICFDTDRAFEPHTREHTMVSKRWTNWTLEQRLTSQQAVEHKLLGV